MKSEEFCWMCDKESGVEEGEIGHCQHCFVDIDRTAYKPFNKEEEMGELAKRAKEKSPFIKLEIGESSEPLIYKSWKEVSGQFGDSFRYSFEIQTEKGFVQKTFDCFQENFAEQMDVIPFGAKVIIHRKQKLDGNGNPMENKSVYSAEEVR